MYCDKCGEELRPGENFCGRCGAKVFAKDKERDPYITALAVRLKNGEEDVFEEIYTLTKGKITKLAYAFYRSFEGDLEDDVQDIYVKAYRKIDTFDPEKGAFTGWLYGVARNCLIDKYKKRTKLLKEEVSETLLAGDDDALITFQNSDLSVVPEAAFDEKAVRSLLEDCMADLSEMQKACIIYRFYNQMSYKEISAILNVSEGSVKSGINAGKKTIEQNVLTLEKQGTKLYALPAMGFVTYLLSRDALSVEAAVKVPEIVVHAAHVSQKAAAETAKGAAGKALGMKAAAVILAAAACTGGAYYAKNAHREKTDVSVQAERQSAEEKKEGGKQNQKAVAEVQNLPIQKTLRVKNTMGAFKPAFRLQKWNAEGAPEDASDKKDVNNILAAFSEGCTERAMVMRSDTQIVSLLDIEQDPESSNPLMATYRGVTIDMETGKVLALKDVIPDEEKLKSYMADQGMAKHFQSVKAGFDTPSTETQDFAWCMDCLGVTLYVNHVDKALRIPIENSELLDAAYRKRPENYIVPLVSPTDPDAQYKKYVPVEVAGDMLRVEDVVKYGGEIDPTKATERHIAFAGQTLSEWETGFFDPYLLHVDGRDYLCSNYRGPGYSAPCVRCYAIKSSGLTKCVDECGENKGRLWREDVFWDRLRCGGKANREALTSYKTLDPKNLQVLKLPDGMLEPEQVWGTFDGEKMFIEK